MLVSSPLMKPASSKGKNGGRGEHSPRRGARGGNYQSPNGPNGHNLSPLFLDGNSPRSNPSLIRSPQRKLFGLEKQGPENVENDKDTPKRSKRKPKKVTGSPQKDKRDVSPVGNVISNPAVDFSKLFPERSTSAGSNSSSNSRTSILLGPRSSRPPPQATRSTSSSSSSSSSSHLLPKMGLHIRLAPKSPKNRKKTAPRRPKLSPRKSSGSMSIPKPQLSPTSPMHPPRGLRSSATCNINYNNNSSSSSSNSNNDYFGDFTLTPTALYNSSNNGMNAPMSAMPALGGGYARRQPQYYHQSPHWTGQVRVNPFSPLPEQYLRPPTSTKSATSGNRKRQGNAGRYPGFYDWNLSMPPPPPSLPSGEIGAPVVIPRKRRPPHSARATRSMRSTAAALPLLDVGAFDDVSPTDVTQHREELHANKRKTPPHNTEGNKRMRPAARSRYLNDFEEVRFLGSGSFGSVHACLSRLDGCTYAVKSVSPTSARRGRKTDGGFGNGLGGGADAGAGYLYGGLRTTSNQCAIPPTPRRDSWTMSPPKRRKAMGRFAEEWDDEDNGDDLGALDGSVHWNGGALRRMLREVFALAALCQQDDIRTFHIVRYQQAWLEDDGTLYIQTELCSATLRDEMSGKRAADGKVAKDGERDGSGDGGGGSEARPAIDAFRQLKVLREVLLALELVHQQGMVHLDIKPENIMVKNDLYKLGDFGLANSFTKNEGGGVGTMSVAPDIEEGDSRYMSKDLLDFRPKDLTKCDVFSLGATMYEACTGHALPPNGREWQDLRNGRLPRPFPPSTLPRLAAVVREMMHPDPDRRPSATELLSPEVLGRGEGDSDPLPFGSARKSSYRVSVVSKAACSDGPSLKRSASF